jgi:hypothetical protein
MCLSPTRLVLIVLVPLSIAGCQRVEAGLRARRDAAAILTGMQQGRAPASPAASSCPCPPPPALPRADEA